jgi:hypothetical protein
VTSRRRNPVVPPFDARTIVQGVVGAVLHQTISDMLRPPAFVVRAGWYGLDPPQRCPKCGAEDGIKCVPGAWPACWRCGVKVLLWGRVPSAPCVTPNGRVDGHMSYVRTDAKGRTSCAFCGERAT